MKHKLITNTLLLTILCGCSNTISPSDSQTSASSNYIKPESFKVYDVYLDDGYPSNKTFILEEFEDQTFHISNKSGAIINDTYGNFSILPTALAKLLYRFTFLSSKTEVICRSGT